MKEMLIKFELIKKYSIFLSVGYLKCPIFTLLLEIA